MRRRLATRTAGGIYTEWALPCRASPLRALQPGAASNQELFPYFAQFVLERYTQEIKDYRCGRGRGRLAGGRTTLCCCMHCVMHCINGPAAAVTDVSAVPPEPLC